MKHRAEVDTFVSPDNRAGTSWSVYSELVANPGDRWAIEDSQRLLSSDWATEQAADAYAARFYEGRAGDAPSQATGAYADTTWRTAKHRANPFMPMRSI